MKKNIYGSITITANLNVWDHEIRTAQALASNGYMVQFLPKSENHKTKTCDANINGLLYELKSPASSKLSAIERNLKRTYH